MMNELYVHFLSVSSNFYSESDPAESKLLRTKQKEKIQIVCFTQKLFLLKIETKRLDPEV